MRDEKKAAPAAVAVPAQQHIMPKGDSAAPQLRAMATNYPAGHHWDKLDAKVCIRGALEIEALRAAAPQPPACQTCNDNGMIGGPSYYAPDEGGVPCPDCSAPQPPVAAQEPVVWQHKKPIVGEGGEATGYTDWRDGKGLEWWPHRALYTHPAPQPAPVAQGDAEDAARWRVINEQFIDDYLEDYELIGEAEGVGDCCYTPTETERYLIKDAVMGLLAVAEDAARAQAKEGGA